MTAQKDHWFYEDDETGQWTGPIPIAELDRFRTSDQINDYTRVANAEMLRRGGPAGIIQGIAYSTIIRLVVDFSPTVEELHTARVGKSITVLSGPNNGGKSLLLKQLFCLVGHEGYLIACNRFSQIADLNTRQQNVHEYRQYYDNFLNSFYTSHQNTEDNQLRLDQIITGLKNDQREKLFSVAKDLLGNVFSLKRTDQENEFSPYYVDMDGEHLAARGSKAMG